MGHGRMQGYGVGAVTNVGACTRAQANTARKSELITWVVIRMSLQDRKDDLRTTADARAAGHLHLVRAYDEPAADMMNAAPESAHADLQLAPPMSGRALAMLRAVAAGRAELVLGCEPDMVIDGLPCCDQFMAHDLARAGLVCPARFGLIGHQVPAILTDSGRAVLSAAASVA